MDNESLFNCIFRFGVFVLLSVLLGLRCPVSVYAAVSTPSNSDFSDPVNHEGDFDLEEDSNVSNQELYAVVVEIRDLLSVPVPASPSDAVDAADEVANISVYEDAVAYAVSGLPDRNVIVYDGSFGGTSCKLVFPASLQSSLWVDDSGYLFNVSGSNLVGRMFFTDSFDYSDYEYDVFTMRSVLTNTSNDILRYGYPSYRTHYYRSTSTSLQSDVTYGLFKVSEVKNYVSDSVDYKVYSVLLVVIFMIGGVWLCLWKRSSNS